MKQLKKQNIVFIFLLVVISVFGIGACGNSKDMSDKETSQTQKDNSEKALEGIRDKEQSTAADRKTGIIAKQILRGNTL